MDKGTTESAIKDGVRALVEEVHARSRRGLESRASGIPDDFKGKLQKPATVRISIDIDGMPPDRTGAEDGEEDPDVVYFWSVVGKIAIAAGSALAGAIITEIFEDDETNCTESTTQTETTTDGKKTTTTQTTKSCTTS